jgi:hypothetical protein
MKTYLIAFAATLAIVAILAVPHRGNPGSINDSAWISGSSSAPELQKQKVTPIQAQMAAVGLAFGR